MPTQVASPVSTGGYGTDFERDVVAWAAMHMLRDRPILTGEGHLASRLNVQTRVDGWLFDDVVLESANEGQPSRIAISVKSNPGFAAGRWPTDVLEPLWEQYLNRAGRSFDAESDFLCLIVGDMDDAIYRSLRSLIGLARECEPAIFVARMETESNFCTGQVRSLWSACACPLTDSTATSEDQARMLSRLRLIKLNFRDDHSSAKEEAIALCRESLVVPTQSVAENLWLQVRNLVCEIAPVSGGLTRTKMLAILRARFPLNAAPYFEEDFARLARDSTALRHQVRIHTGPKEVILTRQGLAGQFRAKLATAQIVFVVGSSGSGKSSLCATISDGFRWWLSTAQLRGSSLSEFEGRLGITSQLHRLLPAVPDSTAIVCIDGLDHCHEHDALVWSTLASLSQILFSAESCGAWKMILPVQAHSVDRIREELRTRNVNFSSATIEVPVWTDTEWQELTQHYTWISEAAQRSGAAAYFKVPKLTDWLVNRGEAVFQATAPQGGSLIERLWHELIIRAGNPSLAEQRQRGDLLTGLSARLADAGSRSINVRDLGTDQLPIAESLEAAGVLRFSDTEVLFAHDLAADWSRVVSLCLIEESIDAIATREALPDWHRAIRLRSGSLMDGAQSGVDLWTGILDGLLERQATRAGDLWVEGIIHCQAPAESLTKLKARADFDILLQRLLVVFEVSGTVAEPLDPRLDQAQLSPEMITVLANASRQPSGTAWVGLFEFIRHNTGSLSQAAAALVCRLARIWLTSKTRASSDQPTTIVIAECVLDIAERFVRDDLIDYGEGGAVVNAVGFSFKHQPERVKTAFRQLAGLTAPAVLSNPDSDPPGRRRRRRRNDAADRVDPWPGGASWRVNETFVNACLNGDALAQVAANDPPFIFEIIFALLVEDSNEKAYSIENERSEMRETMLPRCSLSFRCYSYPQQGHFLIQLLSWTAPVELLRFAIRLTEFVTAQWHDDFVKHDRHDLVVRIPATSEGRDWLSFPMMRRFDWSSLPHPADKILGVILDSWNLRLTGGENISGELMLVLNESTSSPLLDLLVTLGLKHPVMLVGPLFDIATCPFLCQRHSDLMHALRSMGKTKPDTMQSIDTTVAWWEEEARRRGWSDSSRSMFSRWRTLATAEVIDEQEWHRFFGTTPPDPISVSKCLAFLQNPRDLLNRGFTTGRRDMLVERLSMTDEPGDEDRAEDDGDEQSPRPTEAKRCAAASVLLYAALGPTEVSTETLQRCRDLLLPHAQPASTQPNGLNTHFNYGLLGQMHYQREEGSPRGLMAYVLAAMLAKFPEDMAVRSAFAQTMFAQEIIFTDMMWKTINLLGVLLGDDYTRSLHLVLRVAAVREGNRCLGGGFAADNSAQKEATKSAAAVRLEMLCNSFSTKTISAEIPIWSEIIAEEFTPIRRLWNEALEPWEQNETGGFDTYLMDHSQPRYGRLTDGSLNTGFVSWWSRCAEYISSCERIENERVSSERWTHGHFGSWIQSLARATLLIGGVASSQPLWQPILSLGPNKLKNIKDFLDYWWQEALDQSAAEEVVAGFVEGFVNTLRPLNPVHGQDIGYDASALWTAALGLQDEFRARTKRAASVRCPPVILAEIGPILVATRCDYLIRSMAQYISLGFSGIEDADTIGWFGDHVTPGSYVAGHAETAQVLLTMLVSAKNRSSGISQSSHFRRLLNTLAAHPWPDAVRFQEEISVS